MKMKNVKRRLLSVLMVMLFAAGLSTAAYASDTELVGIKPTGGEINGVQLFNGRVFVAHEDMISVTEDLINFDVIDELTPEALSYYLPNIANYGDIIFFNNATMYSTDGVSFYPTVSDIELSNGLRYILHWNGYYISISQDIKSNYVFMSSADGINWHYRGECEFSPLHIFEFNGALWILEGKDDVNSGLGYDAYYTTDGINFVRYSAINGLLNGKNFVCAYRDGFIIASTHDNEAERYYEGNTYYVSNDMRNWRVLIKDGTLMENTSSWGLYYDSELDFDVLDNAMPGGLPLTKESADSRNITNAHYPPLYANIVFDPFYYGYKSMADELSLKDGVISEGINPEADITATFMHGIMTRLTYRGSEPFFDSISLSYDGGTTYQYGVGSIGLQGIATDGKGMFLCNAERGGLLRGTLIRQGGKIDMELHTYVFNPDGSGINAIKYVNGRYLLCTFTGGLYSSADSKSWCGEAAVPATLNDIIYNGSYIAAGDDGIYTSPDLSQWTRVYTNEDSMRSVCAGRDGLLVAGGEGILVYSEDGGGTWNDANTTVEELATINSVMYGNGRYVATGGMEPEEESKEYGQSFTSADGINWEGLHQRYENVSEGDYEEDTDDDIFYVSARYVGQYVQSSQGGFFAVTGLNRSGDGHILTSRDGVEWEYLNVWGVDLCSPLDNLVVYLRYNLLVFADYDTGESLEISVSEPVIKAAELLTPSNIITPLFDANDH
jgi:hypothetical protein